MKALSNLALTAILAGSLSLSSCSGSYYIADQPVEPIYERPVTPYGGAIWIDGDWIWNSGRYVYRHGYWNRPRAGRTYVRGSWAHSNGHGYRWNKGYWKR